MFRQELRVQGPQRRLRLFVVETDAPQEPVVVCVERNVDVVGTALRRPSVQSLHDCDRACESSSTECV